MIRVIMLALKVFILILSAIFILFLLSSLFQISTSQIDRAIVLTQENLYNTTLFLAFIGGILTIFAPCLFPILTAYFAYTFKEKKELTKNTLIFFLGFISVFIPFGLSLSLLGQFLRIYNTQLVTISGIFIVFFGIMIIFGRGFSLIKIPLVIKNNSVFSTYLLGISFTLGWAPCVGPILFSILFLAANLPNIFYSVILLLLFSVGMWIPLFITSYFYDKQKFYKNKWIIGREIKITSKTSINTTNFISGLLLIFLGSIYIIFKGTAFLNVNTLWTQSYILQGTLLSSQILKAIGDYLGIITIIMLIVLFIYSYNKIIKK